MKKQFIFILFCFCAMQAVGQRPDSVQVNGQWYYIYPLQQKLNPGVGLLDKMDLSETQFELFRQWKLSDDPRLKLSKRVLIDSLNRELLRTRVTVTKEQNKYEWREATRPQKMIRPFIMRKKHWYRNHPELLTNQANDRNYDLVPAIQSLPNGKYIQYFEPILSYNEMKNTTVLPPRVAAMFELKNNLLENEFTRFNYKGDTIRHGFFVDGLKEGQWTISDRGTYLRSGIHGLRKNNTISHYNTSNRVELKKGILDGPFYKWTSGKYEQVGQYKSGYADGIWKIDSYYQWRADQLIDYNSVLDSNYEQWLAVAIAPTIALYSKYTKGFDFKEKKRDYHSLTYYECQEEMYEQGVPALPIVDFNDLMEHPLRAGLVHLKTVNGDEYNRYQYNNYRNTGHVNFHGTKQVFEGTRLIERYTYLPEVGAIVYARFYKNGAVFDTLCYQPNTGLFVHHIFDGNGKLYSTTIYNGSGEQERRIDYYTVKKKKEKAHYEAPVIIEGFETESPSIYYKSKLREWTGSEIRDGKLYTHIEWLKATKKRTFAQYTDLSDNAQHRVFYTEGNPVFDETLIPMKADSLKLQPNYYDTLNTVIYGNLQWKQEQARDAKGPVVLSCDGQPFSGELHIRLSGKKLQLDDDQANGLDWSIPKDLYSEKLQEVFKDHYVATKYNVAFSKRERFGWSVEGNSFTTMMLELFQGHIGLYGIERMEGGFENGQPAGDWNYYGKKGKLIFTLHFANGLPNGDGVVLARYRKPRRSDRKYHNDEPYYDFLFSKDAPKIYREKTFHLTNGELDGPSVTYTAMGDTTEISDYKMGVLHGKVWMRRYDVVSSSEYQNGLLHGFMYTGKLAYNSTKEIILDTTSYAHYENGLLHGDVFIEFYESDPYENRFDESGTLLNRYYESHYSGQSRKTLNCRFNHGLMEGKYIQRKGSGETEYTIALTKGIIDTLMFFENGAPSYFYDYAESERLLPYKLTDTAALGLKSRFFYKDQFRVYFMEGLLNEYGSTVKWGYTSYRNEGDMETYKQGRFTKLYPNGNIARRGFRFAYKNYGDWDFYSYEGRRLYSIDYGTQTVTIDGIIYPEEEIKGVYIEYDSLGNQVCRGFMIEELEKYDCAHSDYYAIRQFVITEDRPGDAYERTNGPMRYYFDNGMLMSEGSLKGGLPDGVWKFYTPDGKLTRIGKYVNGKKEGRWLKGDLGDKKYIGEICLNPDDPLLDFHIAELERMRDVEIEVYRNGVAQIRQQYEVTD